MTLEFLTPPDNAIWKRAYSLAVEDGKTALLEAIPPQDRNYLLKVLRQATAEIMEGTSLPRDIHQIHTTHLRIEYSSTRSGLTERDVEIFQIAGPMNRLGAFEPDQFFAFDKERRRKQFKLARVRGVFDSETGEVITDLGSYLTGRMIKR